MDINGAIAGKVAKVLSLLDLPWPGGDPAALRRLAGNWRAMAQELSQTADHLDIQVSLVVGAQWKGAAADAFQAHWQQQHQAMVQSAQSFEQVARELDAYADQAEQIIAAIVEIALEIAEMELAGALLTVVTAGISDLVSAAASGERALKIVQLIDKFIKMAEKAEKVVTELIEEIRKLGAIPRIIVDALKNTAANLGGTQLSNWMSGKGLVNGSDLETAALSGAGAAGIAGGAWKLGTKLEAGAADGAPSKIASFLQGDGTFSNMAIGGISGAGGNVAADVYEGNGVRATAADALTGGLTGAAGAGAAGELKVDPVESSGRHAASGEQITPISQDFGVNAGIGGSGSAMEGAVNQNPTLPKQDRGADGAVVGVQ